MKVIYYTLLGFFCSLPLSVLADSGPGGGGVKIENPIEAESITALFTALLEILLIFAIPIVVFFIIYAGFLYVTARGNVETVTRAHRALLYALIGGVLILGGNVLINVIQGTVDEIKSDSST